MKRRLFVGTFLPKSDQDSLGELQEHSEKLAAEWQRKLRWVRPEKLHLTWVFLGSVDEDYIPEIQSKLTALLAEQPPLDVVYSKPTFWPGPKHARTFVLTPDTVSDEVMNLADRIKRDMKPYAEKIEPKYRPHITVMRFDGNTRGRL
jgi:RNA 2',3'-cyclic 3'-phosphodiesterase